MIILPKIFVPQIFWTPIFFGPKNFFNLNFLNINSLDNIFLDNTFYLPKYFLDPTLLTLVFGLGLFLDQQFFNLFFLTKTTTAITTKTTTILMVFDTIEINLVILFIRMRSNKLYPFTIINLCWSQSLIYCSKNNKQTLLK